MAAFFGVAVKIAISLQVKVVYYEGKNERGAADDLARRSAGLAGVGDLQILTFPLFGMRKHTKWRSSFDRLSANACLTVLCGELLLRAVPSSYEEAHFEH